MPRLPWFGEGFRCSFCLRGGEWSYDTAMQHEEICPSARRRRGRREAPERYSIVESRIATEDGEQFNTTKRR